MLPSNKVVKLTASTALKGKFKGIFSAFLIIVLFFCMFLVLPFLLETAIGTFWALVVVFALLLFLFSPLILGGLYFTRRLLWGEDDNPVLIFYYFSDFTKYTRALKFSVLFLGRAAVICAIFLIPSITASLLSNNAFYAYFGSTMPSFAPSLWIVSLLLEIAAFVLTYVVMAKFFAAPFIFVSNDDLTPERAIELSVFVSRQVKTDFYWLTASLFVPIILSLLVLPMPLTLPYIAACYMVFCRFVLAKYNKDVDTLNTGSAPSFEAEY